MTNEVHTTNLLAQVRRKLMSSYFSAGALPFSGLFGLKQTSTIATMDLGAADRASGQIIHGPFLRHFSGEYLDSSLYTE